GAASGRIVAPARILPSTPWGRASTSSSRCRAWSGGWGGKRALARGYGPAFSEVYLRYGARREVALRRGNQLPPDSAGRIKPYLCDDDVLRPEAFERFEQFVEEVGRDGHEVRCHDDAVQFVAQFRDRKALAAR